MLEEQLFSISRELKGQTQNVDELLQKKVGEREINNQNNQGSAVFFK